MSVRVGLRMLADGRKAWRKPRTSLRFAGQIGELAGLSAKTGITIAFHRCHVAAEFFGSSYTMRCQTCGETERGRHWLAHHVEPRGKGQMLAFASRHLAKGCRVYMGDTR